MSERLPRRVHVVLVGCLVCQLGLGLAYVFGATLKHIVSEFSKIVDQLRVHPEAELIDHDIQIL